MRTALLLAATLVILSGCAAVPPLHMGTTNLPPLMALEELGGSYQKIGRIQVTRKVYGTDYAVSPNLHEWAILALREEAGKLNADAVILPEISSRQIDIVVFPSFPATEYRASGVAIKFGR